MPGSSALPPNTCANSGDARSSASKPSSAAISRECASSRGAATGVGATADQAAPCTWRRKLRGSGSPGRARRKALSKAGRCMRHPSPFAVMACSLHHSLHERFFRLEPLLHGRRVHCRPVPSAISATGPMSADASPILFADLGLPESLLAALREVGYESPSPIQAATIPPLLAGRDVLGQAQTGTGKTAAFALPALARLDAAPGKPQVLVLAPTRELAIQVAEAFQKYAHHIPGFQVLPIYGGQHYG